MMTDRRARNRYNIKAINAWWKAGCSGQPVLWHHPKQLKLF